MREIGLETFALWQYYITTRLEEIMPKYVEIAKAQVAMGDIFETTSRREQWEVDKSGTENQTSTDTKNTDRTQDNTGTFSSDSEGSENTSSTGKTTDGITNSRTEDTSESSSESGETGQNGTTNAQKLYSDTPQNGLPDVIAGRYLTNATVESGTSKNDGTSSGESSGSGHTSEEITRNQTTDDTATTNANSKAGITGTTTQKIVAGILTTDDGKIDKLSSGKEDGGRWYTGYDGKKAETLYQYNELYLSIFQMIIGDVADMFMSIL